MSTNKNTNPVEMDYTQLVDLEDKLEMNTLNSLSAIDGQSGETLDTLEEDYDDSEIYNFLNSGYKTQAGKLVIETAIEANIETKTVDAKSYLSSNDFTSPALSFYADSITGHLFDKGRNRENLEVWKSNIDSLFVSLDKLGIIREDLNSRAFEALNAVEQVFEYMKTLNQEVVKEIKEPKTVKKTKVKIK